MLSFWLFKGSLGYLPFCLNRPDPYRRRPPLNQAASQAPLGAEDLSGTRSGILGPRSPIPMLRRKGKRNCCCIVSCIFVLSVIQICLASNLPNLACPKDPEIKGDLLLGA